MSEAAMNRSDEAATNCAITPTIEKDSHRRLTGPERGFMLRRLNYCVHRSGLFAALALSATLVLAAPAAGQEYQTPTTPQYQTPGGGGKAPEEGAGETPADQA